MSNTNKIRLITPTMTHHDNAHRDRENGWDSTKIAKMVTSLLIAGFRDNTIDNKDLDGIIQELDTLGTALGEKLSLDERMMAPTSTGLQDSISGALGLLYISQITQGLAFGKLTRDPVVALALAGAWNDGHTELTLTDQLNKEAADRYLDLTGSNDEGQFADELVAEYVNNFNTAGCMCGECGDEGEEGAGEVPPEVLAAIDRLASKLPPELLAALGVKLPTPSVFKVEENPAGDNEELIQTILASLEKDVGQKLRPDQHAAAEKQIRGVKPSVIALRLPR